MIIECPDCSSENVMFELDEDGIVIIRWDYNEGRYYSQLECLDCGTKFRRYFKLDFIYTKKNED